MTRRLQRGAFPSPLAPLVPRVAVLVAFAALTLSACGGDGRSQIAMPAATAPVEEWPPRSTSPADAATVATVLGSADGAQVRVRAYLVAVTLPCPACNTSLGQGRSSPRPNEGAIGRARPPDMTPGPGCAPCPPPAATFSDEAPKASAAPTSSGPLRAVGAAAGLQPRHVGHLYLLSGTFHVNGPHGAELDVTDIRALDP